MATARLAALLPDDVAVELRDDLARREVCGAIGVGVRVDWRSRAPRSSRLRVRVDADVAGDRQRALGDLARAAAAVASQQRARRGQRVGAARADRDDAVVGLDHVAGAGEDEACFSRSATRAAPRAGAARGRCASPWPARPRRAAGCRSYSLSFSSNFSNSVMPSAAEPANPARILPSCRRRTLRAVDLHDGVAERDLPVAADDDLAVAAHRQNRRRSDARVVFIGRSASRLDLARGWALS